MMIHKEGKGGLLWGKQIMCQKRHKFAWHDEFIIHSLNVEGQISIVVQLKAVDGNSQNETLV